LFYVHPTSKLSRPCGTDGLSTAIPTLKRWATFDHPSGMGTDCTQSSRRDGNSEHKYVIHIWY
jgi:hypothetical protein